MSYQKKFKGHFECLGENKEKYLTFSAPIKREIDNGKVVQYRLKALLVLLRLLIALYLCQAHFQALSIIYLKGSIAKNVENVSLVLNIYQSKIINNMQRHRL